MIVRILTLAYITRMVLSPGFKKKYVCVVIRLREINFSFLLQSGLLGVKRNDMRHRRDSLSNPLA